MNDQAPEMLKPTLIAGLVFGVAANIPVVNILNVCTCCGFIWGCGFVASYLYSRRCKEVGAEFRAGAGALVGLIAGAFYAVISSVVGGLLQLILPQPAMEEIIEQMESMGGMPPEMMDMIYEVGAFMEETGTFMLLVIVFFMTVLISAVFSTLGGLIGGAIFKVEAQPPASPGAAGGPTPPPSNPI